VSAVNTKELKSAVHTLHRYYIWANRMRLHFYALVPKVASNPKPERFTDEAIEADMYMSLWYGQLYVVIEGYRKLKLSDPAIDASLASPNVALLKRYRNGVFHFQKNYFDDHFISFMRDAKDPAHWVSELNRAFGAFFLNRFRLERRP
jgi:hypothetical protein